MGLFDNIFEKKASINIPEIDALTDIIFNCSDLSTLINIYNQKGEYDNPQISYAFGLSFIIQGDKARAKKALLKGASYGLKFPCEFYDTHFIDAIGQCFMLLLTQFPIEYSDKVLSYTSLAYVYLSKFIEQNGIYAWDTYHSRALLFYDHESPMVWQNIFMDNLGQGILIEPFIISDFYFASKAQDSPHQNALASARRIHQGLEDITISGKDADDYSLVEISELGKQRHFILFKRLEEKYKNGELTDQKVDNTFTFHKDYFHEEHLPIINFFKRYGFGTNNPVMTYLSVLATKDRCVILEALYNPNILDSILSDKLLLAYVTSGKKELAQKVIENSIRNGENNMNVFGLKSKLDLDLAPTRNRQQRLVIYDDFLSKTSNPIETEFLNILINFCIKYYD